MTSEILAERLFALEERMERVERLSYVLYVETRRIAEYAYLNVRLEEDAETIRRIPGMRGLTDDEAIKSGMETADVVALKFKQRFLIARCRRDALEIAKELADERKRRPVVEQPEKQETEKTEAA